MRLRDNYGITELGMVLSIVGGVLAIVAITLVSAIYGGRAVGRTTCRNWATQTGVPTKFVTLNWSDSGTCLGRTPDGRWVLNSRWQAFVGADK